MWVLLRNNCKTFYLTGRNNIVYCWTVRKQQFQIFVWKRSLFQSTVQNPIIFKLSSGPTAGCLITCWVLKRTALRKSWSRKGLLEEERRRHICVLLLCCRGSAWHKNSTSVWFTYNLDRWQNSHNEQFHLCLIFGDWCFFTKTILLQTSQGLSLYFFLWCHLSPF